jgi:hypothetical protein
VRRHQFNCHRIGKEATPMVDITAVQMLNRMVAFVSGRYRST